MKGPHFIDLGGGTPKQTLASCSPPHSQPNIETSPQDVDMSPFRPDFEVNSPPQHFGQPKENETRDRSKSARGV